VLRRQLAEGDVHYQEPVVLEALFDLANAFGVHVVPHSAYFGPGLIAVPQAPGLGVEPDASVIEQLRISL
jgi:L-alanine-DL-glutamate epimerase-like enolase superfamily enzyme